MTLMNHNVVVLQISMRKDNVVVHQMHLRTTLEIQRRAGQQD
jgi:hypothetical protein